MHHVARGTGDRPPCRRVPVRDLFENKKFYRKVPVAHCLGDRCLSPPKWATRGYFCNLLKRLYIFEILFFLNIKKKKAPHVVWQILLAPEVIFIHLGLSMGPVHQEQRPSLPPLRSILRSSSSFKCLR